MVGKATPDRGGPRKAPMEWTPKSGEQERHKVTVITVGSKYEVYVRSPAPSHMQTLNNPFELLQIEWEVNIIVKKSSCVLSSCVVYDCVCYHCVGMYPVYICIWEYNINPSGLFNGKSCLYSYIIYMIYKRVVCKYNYFKSSQHSFVSVQF